MILLTDISFFNQPIQIPNINEADGNVANNVMNQVRRYEPEILKDVLGYGLYSSLKGALSVSSTLPIWSNLLFGAQYTDASGNLNYFRGIIDTDSTVISFGSGTLSVKQPEWITVGVTQNENGEVIIPAAGSSFTNEFWIGYTPILTLNGVKVLKPGVDYTYNILTGELSLIGDDNVFSLGEDYFVQFQVIYNPVTTDNTFTYKASFIADYVYYWYQRNNVTSSSGIGETVPTSKNAINVSPAQKMADAWNDMSDRLCEMWDFLDANQSGYTDWKGRDYRVVCKYGKINTFGI